jgi:hypothetical protein
MKSVNAKFIWKVKVNGRLNESRIEKISPVSLAHLAQYLHSKTIEKNGLGF